MEIEINMPASDQKVSGCHSAASSGIVKIGFSIGLFLTINALLIAYSGKLCSVISRICIYIYIWPRLVKMVGVPVEIVTPFQRSLVVLCYSRLYTSVCVYVRHETSNRKSKSADLGKHVQVDKVFVHIFSQIANVLDL